jgi:tripartite-type tricarboxylate transporter receptor subunit TctC
VTDITPVSWVCDIPIAIGVSRALNINSLKQLVAYAKAHPGKLSYASYAQGSTSHLNGELLKMRTGIDMVHIPYKGTADASRALMAGDVQLYFDGTASAVEAIKAGRAKGLGAATPTRVAVLADLPTIAEQGVPGLDIVGWQGVFGPGNMPPAVAKKVSELLSKISRGPDILKLVQLQGNEPSGAPAAEFAAIVRADSERWGEVIRAAKIKLD